MNCLQHDKTGQFLLGALEPNLQLFRSFEFATVVVLLVEKFRRSSVPRFQRVQSDLLMST